MTGVSHSLRSRLISLAAAIALVAGVGAAAASIAPTHSAWTDASYSSAAVTAGDWTPAPPPASFGCVAMNADGSVMKDGTCKVTRVVFDQWGDNSQHNRNYYVDVASNAGPGYVQLTLDLSAATMNSDTGTGTWKWTNAATTGGEITPTSACSALPSLVANTTTMWQSTRTFYFTMVDKRSSGSATCK